MITMPTGKKPILVSGLQPTGRLHIGNYLGALKNMVALQNSGKYDCFFFIADLHSLTEEFEPKVKHRQIVNLAADYLAVGLDPKKSVIFLQSQVPAHSELSWIFNAIAPLGELYRMTQFKDKSESQRHNVNAGLLTYPLLMAADILLYDPKFVPVGDDQVQHLELTRTMARKFNSRFGRTFTEPQPILTKASRVMSLASPEKKMSKSTPESCLFMDDSSTDIKRKVMRAVTDSGSEIKHDVSKKPAISNLLEIYSGITCKPISRLEKEFAGKRYSDFKASLAKELVSHLDPLRKRKKGLLKNPGGFKAILEDGRMCAERIANAKIAEVKKKLGLVI
ncbi:MAG: tryptophan--tRNA ligase [Candidatus Liptonbacteria bacterium]